MHPISSFSEPMVYEMMLVKANILNDKESGNSKKDSVKQANQYLGNILLEEIAAPNVTCTNIRTDCL